MATPQKLFKIVFYDLLCFFHHLTVQPIVWFNDESLVLKVHTYNLIKQVLPRANEI